MSNFMTLLLIPLFLSSSNALAEDEVQDKEISIPQDVGWLNIKAGTKFMVTSQARSGECWGPSMNTILTAAAIELEKRGLKDTTNRSIGSHIPPEWDKNTKYDNSKVPLIIKIRGDPFKNADGVCVNSFTFMAQIRNDNEFSSNGHTLISGGYRTLWVGVGVIGTREDTSRMGVSLAQEFLQTVHNNRSHINSVFHSSTHSMDEATKEYWLNYIRNIQ